MSHLIWICAVCKFLVDLLKVQHLFYKLMDFFFTAIYANSLHLLSINRTYINLNFLNEDTVDSRYLEVGGIL